MRKEEETEEEEEEGGVESVHDFLLFGRSWIKNSSGESHFMIEKSF